MEKTQSSKKTAVILSVVSALFIMVLIFAVGGVLRPESDFDFSAYREIDPAAAEAAYLDSGSNDDLVSLLFSLCFQIDRDGASSYKEKFVRYGNELFEKAKQGTIDLETAAEAEQMAAMIRKLNSYGVNAWTALD